MPMYTLLLAATLAAAPAKQARPAEPTQASAFKVPRGKQAPPTGHFEDCDISSGQAIRCGDTYQGRAVVITAAGIRECEIHDGAIIGCDGDYQGRAVVPHEGIFQECDIGDGVVSRCNAWVSEGKAAVWKGKGLPVAPKPKKEEKKDDKEGERKDEKECSGGKGQDGKKCDDGAALKNTKVAPGKKPPPKKKR